MTSKFRNPILAAMIAGLSVSLAAPMASAQAAKGAQQGCVLMPDGSRKCDGKTQPGRTQAQPGKTQAQPGKQPAKMTQTRKPYVGESARQAPRFQQAKNSRLPVPPAHQHYRVLNGNVVRVDDNTLKVVAVVGLLSALANN